MRIRTVSYLFRGAIPQAQTSKRNTVLASHRRAPAPPRFTSAKKKGLVPLLPGFPGRVNPNLVPFDWSFSWD